MIKNNLSDFWKKKQLERGDVITIQEVCRATGLNWETVDNLRRGNTHRYDANVVAKICEFFGVAEGPIPFLSYTVEDN